MLKLIGEKLYDFFNNFLIAPFLEERAARRKIQHFSYPIWVACCNLQFRFYIILGKPRYRPAFLKEFNGKLEDISWLTDDGYYNVSTAYLIADLAAWISLFQQSVVTLRFATNSLTSRLYDHSILIKQSIAFDSDVLPFNYLTGIGDSMLQERGGETRVLSFYEYIDRLVTDTNFRRFHSRLVRFACLINKKENAARASRIWKSLEETKDFLNEKLNAPLSRNIVGALAEQDKELRAARSALRIG